ncbi:MAG: ECF-type sigma factor [Phycisphaerae bacterium]
MPNESSPSPRFAEVYAELLAIARNRLRSERRDHTLQATALVNEAWLRLCGAGAFDPSDRRQFFSAAAEAMRRILIDHARARATDKRGGGDARRVQSLDAVAADLSDESNADALLALDEAITRLDAIDPQAGKLVRLRFFAGLSVEDTAEVLGISTATVKREWQIARARLYRDLSGGDAR